MFASVIFSCKQEVKAAPENGKSKIALINFKDKEVYSKYKYNDADGENLIIQNGFPKGGMKYTDINGEQYNYAIFWTQIINETDKPIELKIDFPVNSYEIPSLPGNYFKILVPSDTITIEKFRLTNYGLTDLKTFLDQSLHKQSSLNRAINPKESSAFYVVMLCLVNGAHGTLRTGFSIKGQNLYYKINDKEISCGSISLRNLTLEN